MDDLESTRNSHSVSRMTSTHDRAILQNLTPTTLQAAVADRFALQSAVCYAKRLIAHATFHGDLWRPLTLSMSVDEVATVT
ncbi:hypothetical protein CDO26_21580 (plasmid) [Sinorhizobium meliloti]|nr:hypothetical protein CDO26_21580 [Sinorhizobium meliloti]